MSTISTHVLDTALGKPAAGVAVKLERVNADGGVTIAGFGTTDDDGRVRDLIPAGQLLTRGDYRLRFDTGAYFAASRRESFYPSVSVEFRVTESAGHYHVPLLVSPFGYSTYRGS
ncbi:MAG: hydroxyisourate hydrolase [Gemmatimonadaceae bacterium]|nr:hydroxyisourate hydrolase [Gemmatimonadaceae bacterium]